MRFYPVQGDTAIAELMLDDKIWGDLRLEGIALDEIGEARTTNVEVILRLFPPPEPHRAWEFGLEAAQALIADATSWLLANEAGRLPEPP